MQPIPATRFDPLSYMYRMQLRKLLAKLGIESAKGPKVIAMRTGSWGSIGKGKTTK